MAKSQSVGFDIIRHLRNLIAHKEEHPFHLVGKLQSVLIPGPGSEYKTPQSWVKNNLIVDVGFDFISDAIGASAGRPAVMSHIAVGTGVTAAAVGDTALQTEVARKAATYAHVGGTKVFTFEATFDPGEATGAITESGILNAASTGIMLDRVVFSVINKGALDTLLQKFTFTMS